MTVTLVLRDDRAAVSPQDERTTGARHPFALRLVRRRARSVNGAGRSCFETANGLLSTNGQARAALRGLRFRPLPSIQFFARAVRLRIHLVIVPCHFRSELDHVAVGIAEIDRMQETVIRDS